ncbi:hypothetical protein RvY_04893-2 [Ramazzottius varieornatus]|uniref:Uncharacterized protein n=1 Tax=Ramazzottius varieornatus TaxID=947166 RepID=A0A1D1UT87_RAMVA|nr:hypothetical protein RvY_04893-2 [Ramazzottius varieornatus]
MFCIVNGNDTFDQCLQLLVSLARLIVQLEELLLVVFQKLQNIQWIDGVQSSRVWRLFSNGTKKVRAKKEQVQQTGCAQLSGESKYSGINQYETSQ